MRELKWQIGVSYSLLFYPQNKPTLGLKDIDPLIPFQTSVGGYHMQNDWMCGSKNGRNSQTPIQRPPLVEPKHDHALEVWANLNGVVEEVMKPDKVGGGELIPKYWVRKISITKLVKAWIAFSPWWADWLMELHLPPTLMRLGVSCQADRQRENAGGWCVVIMTRCLQGCCKSPDTLKPPSPVVQYGTHVDLLSVWIQY